MYFYLMTTELVNNWKRFPLQWPTGLVVTDSRSFILEHKSFAYFLLAEAEIIYLGSAKKVNRLWPNRITVKWQPAPLSADPSNCTNKQFEREYCFESH